MKVLVNGVELELTAEQAEKLAPKAEPVVESAPDKAKAAASFLTSKGYTSKVTSKWSRVDCAFGACDRQFDPNGDGAWYHTSCPVATQFYGKFRSAYRDGGKDSAEYQRVLADAKELAANLS